MTREQMIKTTWKPYMSIEYQDKGMKQSAECLLSAIDFDAELLTLTPMDDYYEQKEFQAHISFCTVKKRISVASKNGKIVKDRTENTVKAKKIGIWIDDEEPDNNKAS